MSTDPAAGRLLAGRYRLGETIAHGGMATIVRAHDERLGRDVAVKVLKPPYADDPEFCARFLEEARAAASMSHPSLVHVYDSGSEDGLHFIVMELLEGHRSLRQVLEDGGPLGVVQTVEMGRQLLAGLHVVHERGLVHCDIKAGNVMLGPGPAKLIDFGIARTPDQDAQGVTSLGSLHAMSPEQLRGEPLTQASDLLAVGVVLYQALTGRVPYAGTTPAEVAAAHDAERVRPPSTLVAGIPARLDQALIQALRRDPAARFRTAAALDRALEVALAEHDEEETSVVTPLPLAAADAGYVPPAAPPAQPSQPLDEGPPVATRARTRPPPGRSRGRSGVLSMLVLGTAIVVALLVIVPLLQAARDGGAGSSPSPPASTPPPVDAQMVTVPDTIGLDKKAAIDAAQAAGLEWTIQCAENRGRAKGIIDQEPPAGTQVRRGSRFTMYSARFADCR